jgi:hypothetical protein
MAIEAVMTPDTAFTGDSVHPSAVDLGIGQTVKA